MFKQAVFNLIIIVFVVAGAAIMHFDKRKMNQSDSSSNLKTKPTFDEKTREAIVNKHLNETYQKIRDQKTELKFQATRGRVLGPSSEKTYQPPYSVLGETENDNVQNGSSSSATYRPESPGELIQTELYREQMENAENEKLRQDYASQFIEHARKQGYEVELDENFKVISMKPLTRSPARAK